MPTFEEVKQQQYAKHLLPKGARVLLGQKNLCVDLGCYRSKTPGYVGFDCAPGADADFFCDLNDGIPLEDECCASVVAGHFLEHVADPEFMAHEIWRVCQDGAKVRINVPAVSWDAVFVIEHRHVIAEAFFTLNRCFKALFAIDRLYYQCDPVALETARKYLPDITEEDAGLLLTNVRRQLLVEAHPLHKRKETPSEVVP